MRASSRVVFVISLAVSLLLWQATRSYNERIRRARFHNRVTLVSNKIQDEVSSNERVLLGCCGFFAVIPQATRQAWSEYVAQLDIDRILPGVQGLGFGRRISASELAAHVQSIQEEGFASYTVKPPGARAEYVPVVYLEPFRDLNLRAFGYDMFSDPVRRAAMEQARDGHQTVLSGMVTLVQEGAGAAIQQGFLIYHPIYSPGSASSTIEDRRRALRGYAYLPVRFGDFLDRIVFESNLLMGISVYDGETIDAAHLAYDSTRSPQSEQIPDSYVPTFQETIKLTVLGRVWTVKFLSLPSHDAASDFSKPWYALVLGVVFSAFMGMTFQFLSNRAALTAATELNLALQQVRAELETHVQEQTADLEKANRVLRQSERNLRDAQALAHIGNWSVTLATGEVTWSEEMYKMAGLDPSGPAPTLKEHPGVFTPDSWKRAQIAGDAAIIDGKPYELDLEMRRSDGTTRWVHVVGQVRRDPSGHSVELYGTNQDITNWKRLQDELRKREENYRQLVDHLQAGVVVYSADSQILLCNTLAAALLNLTPESMIGRRVTDNVGYLLREDGTPMTAAEHPVSLVLATSRALHGQVVGIPHPPDGRTVWIQVNAFPEFDDQKHLEKVIVTTMDITALKAAEEQLRAHQENLERVVAERTSRLESIINTATDGIIIISSDGRINSFNPAAERIFGYRATEVIGQNVSCLAPEPVRSQHDGYLKRFLATGIPRSIHTSREVVGMRKDGTTFPLDLAVAEFSMAGERMFSGIVRDISARKQAEDTLKTAVEEAMQASRAKSDFVANVSHEIRTPLNAIIGFANLALKTSLNQKQADYLGKIHLSGLSLLGIVNDILDFSKIDAGKLTLENVAFCFDHVVDSLVAMIGPSAMAKGLNVILNVPFDIPKRLIGDPLHLGQILTNLMSNAVKFTESGEIELNVSHRKISPDTLELCIFLRDTGIGIPPDRLARLFQPFTQADLSTTRKFGGTGLGLSISKRLVELMGGTISIESEMGIGTTVSFTAVLRFDSAVPADDILPANLWDLRILVLETQPTMMAWFRTFFTQFPFAVDVVATTPKALEAIEEKGRTISYDLFLIDSPGIDGAVRSLLQDLRHMSDLWNNPKVILLFSSPREDSLREQAIGLGVSEFLPRPVTPSSVVNAIVNIFASPARERMVSSSMGTDDLGLEGLKLLVVEDNRMNQQIARELLESAGIAVKMADNGRAAVETLLNEAEGVSYDAILMDIQMPEMDGYEATRRIRGMPRFAGTPIIAMTAHALAEEREKVTAAGMNDHVAKPVIPSDLFRTLRRWCRPDSPAGAHASLPTPQPATTDFPSIPGVNVREGLARLGGKSEVYLRLLREFPAAQEGELGKIGQALTTKDLGKARTLIHTLKGLAGNLSLTDLFQTAGTLEKALQASDWAESARGFELLRNAFRRFSQAIDALNPSPRVGPWPVSEEPLKTLTVPRVRELLGELRTMLVGNNPQAGQALKDLRAGFVCPTDCVSDFDALEVAIGQFEFDQALLILPSLEGKLGGIHHAS